MNSHLNRSKKLLISYMRILFETTGLKFDSDNQAEIEEIIDGIIKAMLAELREDTFNPFPPGYGMEDIEVEQPVQVLKIDEPAFSG